MAIAPFRIAAQESAPAASSAAQASTSQSQAKPEGAKSESEAAPSQEEQNEAFLVDGPIVKWIANTFNIEKKTASNICLFINFAIVLFGIVIPLWKFLPKFLRKRAEKVSSDIEAARKTTEDANSRLSAVEAKLAGLDDEIKRLRVEVEAESLQDEARIKAALEDESARIVAAAEQEIGSAAAQARRGLRNFAAELAVEQAAKQMVLTPETDRALIAEFVGDVSKGGQN
jgi:F-type H+-transporting ATPase subunit b